MNVRFRVLTGLALSLTFAAGCSSGSVESSGSLRVAQCDVLMAPPSLVYPAPQATGVDPTVGVLIVAGAASNESLGLTAADGTQVAVGPLGPPPSPLPSGVASPGPQTHYNAASIPQLVSATTYTVKAVVPDVCGSGSHTSTIGAFSTR